MDCELQMWVNVLKALIAVMTMQLATTFKEVTPALATVDTQGMDLHALVSSLVLYSTQNYWTNSISYSSPASILEYFSFCFSQVHSLWGRVDLRSKCDLWLASTCRMAKSRGLARDCSCISVIVSSYTWSCKLSYVLIAMLVSIQVASGCSILKNWGIHSIAESSTVHKVHVALKDRALEGLMYFEFPVELRDQPHWYCDTFFGLQVVQLSI